MVKHKVSGGRRPRSQVPGNPKCFKSQPIATRSQPIATSPQEARLLALSNTKYPVAENPDRRCQEIPSASNRSRSQPDRSRSLQAPRKPENRGCQNADFSQANCCNPLTDQKKLRLLIAIAADRSRSRDQLIAADRNRSRSHDCWRLRAQQREAFKAAATALTGGRRQVTERA